MIDMIQLENPSDGLKQPTLEDRRLVRQPTTTDTEGVAPTPDGR